MRGLLYEHCVRRPRRDRSSSRGSQRINQLVRWRRSWLPRVSIAGTSGHMPPDTASGRPAMRSAPCGRGAIGTGGSSAICVATPGISRASPIARTSSDTSVSTARRSSARSGGRFGAGRTTSASGVHGDPKRTDASIVSSTTVAIRGRRIWTGAARNGG